MVTLCLPSALEPIDKWPSKLWQCLLEGQPYEESIVALVCVQMTSLAVAAVSWSAEFVLLCGKRVQERKRQAREKTRKTEEEKEGG